MEANICEFNKDVYDFVSLYSRDKDNETKYYNDYINCVGKSSKTGTIIAIIIGLVLLLISIFLYSNNESAIPTLIFGVIVLFIGVITFFTYENKLKKDWRRVKYNMEEKGLDPQEQKKSNIQEKQLNTQQNTNTLLTLSLVDSFLKK